MITIDLALDFQTPYVAHPYWPEMYEVIEITKKSGMNRAKSDANRRKALEEYLRANGMTLAGFEALIAAWPVDVQNHLKALATDAFWA